MDDTDIKDLKKVGFMKQTQEGLFSVRLRVPVGNIDSTKLTRVAEAAEKYGKGYVHLSTRQGIEIPYVHEKDLKELQSFLAEKGIQPGSCGPRVRNIIACPGDIFCRYGILNSQDFGLEIDKKYFGMEFPHKFKVAVSGCPNSCAKPQENDVGFYAAIKVRVNRDTCIGCNICENVCPDDAVHVKKDKKAVIDYGKCTDCILCYNACPTNSIEEEARGWVALAGGKIGRHPQLAHEIKRYLSDDEVLNYIDNCIEVYSMKGHERERFGTMINRLGLEEFKKLVLK